MDIRSIKERFKQLQHGPFRFLVAIVATIQQTIKHRSPTLIYVDKDGDWYNRRPDATFVSPELNVYSWNAIYNTTMDFWCYDYSVQRGDTVIDIGAYIGDNTIVFSKLVGVNGRVVAVEAHPRTFRCLVKTINANRIENVIAVNLATTNYDGEIAISDTDNFLSNSVVTGAGMAKIRACSLDWVLNEIGSTGPYFIKMNIEGAETAALLGMQNTLSLAPHIVVSCHDFKADRGDDPSMRTYDDATRILRDAGYIIRGRREDTRKEVSYYLYGRKNNER